MLLVMEMTAYYYSFLMKLCAQMNTLFLVGLKRISSQERFREYRGSWFILRLFQLSSVTRVTWSFITWPQLQFGIKSLKLILFCFYGAWLLSLHRTLLKTTCLLQLHMVPVWLGLWIKPFSCEHRQRLGSCAMDVSTETCRCCQG